MNFAIFLDIKARSHPHELAVADHRLRLTWSELNQFTDQFANFLKDHQLGASHRISFLLPNRVEHVIAILGCMKAGVVGVPLNWRLAGEELRKVVTHCDASFLITTQSRSQEILAFKTPVSMLTVEEEKQHGSFWKTIERYPSTFVTRGCQSHDVANLLYTSGTTSTPKSAIHTHGMRLSIAASMADCFQLSSKDIALAVSPLFHTSGLSVFSNALLVGCPLILLEKWDLRAFVELIAKERITFMHLIGTLLIDIANGPEDMFQPLEGKRCMRFTWGGGHLINPEHFLAFEKRIGGVFSLGYARTEGGLSYNPIDLQLRGFDNNGLPNKNSSELAILHLQTHTHEPQGVIGEICFRGDGLSPGYWDGKYIRYMPLYDGGWHPTGDLGYIDEQLRLHFLGRDDNMIKSGGENVFPDEVAAVLLSIPQITDAVVLGIPNERMGATVAALVVCSDPSFSEKDIDTACRAALASYKIPRHIIFTDALPKLGSGKIDLTQCKQYFPDKSNFSAT